MAFDEIVESSDPVLTPIVIEDLAETFPPDITTWPWPKIISTAYHTLVFLGGLEGILFLFELILSPVKTWEGTQIGVIGTTNDIDFVDVIDFGDYYVVCTVGDTIRNFARTPENEFIELVQPVFGTGCNNKGQLVGGNVSNWKNLNSDGILWSGIGVYEFDPLKDQTAGFRTLVSGKFPGKKVTIHKVLCYMDGIIAYTDFGNVFLQDTIVEDAFVYSLHELEGVGITSGNHIAGNQYVHGFINLNNEFCKFQKNKELQVLGYKRQIEELKSTNTPLWISFLEDRNTFFLSNGIQTLVINDYGAGIIHQAVSGIVKGWDGYYYGTFRDFGDREARITFNGNSMDSRGVKTLEWIIADISHSPTTNVMASSYWRNSASDEWRSYNWKSGSSSGEFFIGLSAMEYRIALKFSEYENSELTGLKLNMKFPDSRSRRGIAAISGVQRNANTETSS